MRERQRSRSKKLWCVLLCAAAVSLASAASADDKGRGHGEKRRGEHRSWAHEHHDRHRDSHWERDGRDHRRWRGWDERRRDYGRGEHYAEAWPPLQRHGRRCSDRRHYHGVHYHVLARDYYDYYYPRYRYYGAAPLHAHASVIITLPLF